MEKKYWVPALERAHEVLRIIAANPEVKLIDLSRQLDIHKSSMFSLLHTLEALRWVVRDKTNSYSLGPVLGQLGGSYLQQFSLIDLFHREANSSKVLIGETVQLSRLEGREVLYLAKIEAATPVRLVSEPGMLFPAHATAMGKVMLSCLNELTFNDLYPAFDLPQSTPHTLATNQALRDELKRIRNHGYAFDLQESVIGFCCVSAAIVDQSETAMGAVSFSMPIHHWEQKREAATAEICRLAACLSRKAAD